MDSKINDLVNEALEYFLEMTGIEKVEVGNGYSWQSKFGRLRAWDVADDIEELNASRELDPSGLTTFMMLRGLTEHYLQKYVSFSAHDLILKRKKVSAEIKVMEALRDTLESPTVVELIESFENQIREAANHYGVVGDAMTALEGLLEDKMELAYVRRDALRSVDSYLDAHQFVQGAPDKNPPKYNPDVYEFWNINSLLGAMKSQKFSGISVVLIRDPEATFHSFFCFAIRNGTTFTVLTDRPDDPHPLHKKMSRRPDRALASRSMRNHFPYQLLDLTTSPDGKRQFIKQRDALVPMNVEAVPLKSIRELDPDQFVWLVLTFDVIRDKFWKQNHLLPEVSYTSEMIVNPHALVGSEGALVREGHYRPLELAPLTHEDLKTDNPELMSQWERKPTKFNQWMIDRYADKVPEDLFNLIGEKSKKLLAEKAVDAKFLPVKKADHVWESEAKKRVATGEIVKIDGTKDEYALALPVETMSAITFGRREQLVKDRTFYARYNEALAIQRLADEEFEREIANVEEWFRKAVDNRREALIEAAVRGEFKAPDVHFGEGPGNPFPNDDENYARERTKNIIRQCVSDGYDGNESIMWAVNPKFKIGEYSRSRRRYMCADDPDRPASIFTIFEPTCPQAIAALLGLTVEDLPWALQNWYKEEPYNGNSILYRLDPSDWKLKNPWRKGFRPTVGVSLSRTNYANRRKELSLPKKVWTDKEDPKAAKEREKAEKKAAEAARKPEDEITEEDLDDL